MEPKDAAKRCLRRYRRLGREIERLQEQLYRLETGAVDIGLRGLDYSQDRVQTSPKRGAAFERPADLKADREQDLREGIEARRLEQAEIAAAVERIKDQTLRDVLYHTYIAPESSGLPYAADLMGYSESRLRQWHEAALRMFAVMNPELIEQEE